MDEKRNQKPASDREHSHNNAPHEVETVNENRKLDVENFGRDPASGRNKLGGRKSLKEQEHPKKTA